MRQLLLFGTAIIVAAAAYVGFSSKEEVKVAGVNEKSSQEISQNQNKNEVLVAAIEEIEKDKNKTDEVLSTAAMEVINNKAVKKSMVKKPIVKKSKLKKTVVKNESIKKINKDIVKANTAIEDKVSTQASSTNATSTTTTTLANDPLGQMGGAGVGGFMSFTGSTDFKETTDETKAYAGQVAMSLRIPLRGKYNLMVGSSFAKDLSGGFDERLNNTNITLGHAPVSIARNTIVIPRLRGIYPTSKASKVRDEMNGGVALTPIFAHQLTSRVGLTYIPTGVAYSHKFKTNRVNKTNNQYTLSQTLIGTYNFTDLLSASAVYSFAQSWSYFGTEKDRQYATDLSMMYIFANRTNLSAGINTGGLLFDAQQGPDSNVEFYNPETTSFYLTYGIAL